MNKIIIPFALVILVVIGAAGWSLLNKPTSVSITKLDPTIKQTSSPTISNTPYPTIPAATETVAKTSPLTYVNPSVTIDAFETAIPAKKYPDLSEFMTPNVTVIKYSSSCCGLISKAKAISEMAYLSGAAGPWDFSDTNPIAAKLIKADPDNFKKAFIGTSANNYAIGLELDDNYLITKIVIVGDSRLIIDP